MGYRDAVIGVVKPKTPGLVELSRSNQAQLGLTRGTAALQNNFLTCSLSTPPKTKSKHQVTIFTTQVVTHYTPNKMAGTLKEKKDLDSLKLTVATVTALLAQLEAAVKTPLAPAAPAKDNINAFTLAHDAAKLIKAHSTKLSLLIINAPFTPTAVTKVLSELASSALPALASAIEVCDLKQYTKIAFSELLYRVQKVLSEFGTLLKIVPLDGKVLTPDQKNGPTGVSANGSLAQTGVVWQACDSLMDLQVQGIAGLVVKKAEQYRNTLKDAIEELHEWAEEESGDEDDGDDEEDATSDKGHEKSAQEEIDEMFGDSAHIPKSDPEKIRPRLVQSERKLKMMVLLYNAAIKRRFRSLPSLPSPFTADPAPGVIESIPSSPAQRIDAIIASLQQIPDTADELANAFYELDSKGIDEAMRECWEAGVAAAELLKDGWNGGEDEFTAWAGKFKLEMEK